MIRGGFLTEEDRGKLVALVRDGSAASRVTRRANALVLLDGGWNCQEVAAALLMDDDTIRGWHQAAVWRGGVGPRVAERSEAGALAGDRREGVQQVACRSHQAIEG
jgi:hypothetical protein